MQHKEPGSKDFIIISEHLIIDNMQIETHCVSMSGSKKNKIDNTPKIKCKIVRRTNKQKVDAKN